jgi:hypothetical protein
VIGALGIVTPAPMLDGLSAGDVGLLAFGLQSRKMTGDDITNWIVYSLAPLLGRFPGPRSVLVLDNMPEVRLLYIDRRQSPLLG